MKRVWEVGQGEYSDRETVAACSSEEQAKGVAVQIGHGAYVGDAIDLWEPEDGIPPYRPIWSCVARPGGDASQPIHVSFDDEPIAVEAELPTPAIVTSPGGRRYPWARAENYLSPAEAEEAARAAFITLMESDR